MDGIGSVHFTITVSNPESQMYFDQGVNLLYSLWWFEAERSFRHAAMLDPDCAMAYWGMAKAMEGAQDGDRARACLKLARQKLAKVTDRERRYIEAEGMALQPGRDDKIRAANYARALEEIVRAYPEDVEAKVMLAGAHLNAAGDGPVAQRAAIDALLQEALARNPQHPGAHRLRIRLLERTPGAAVLESCRAYPQIAPNIGYAQHLPGHVYAQRGLWDQAAQAMEAAARVERRYFYAEGQMPYDSWDYAHELHSLIAVLGYLGRIKEGARLAQELLDAPHDPKYNDGARGDIARQGRIALMRMRIRGEQWDAILHDTASVWTESGDDAVWKRYTLGMAYLGRGERAAALRQAAALDRLKAAGAIATCARLELRGRLAVVEGDFARGLAALKQAAEIEKTAFAVRDPNPYPHPLYESLAWGYLAAGRRAEAEATLQEGLRREPNNGSALALLVQALVQAGKRAEAAAVYAQLRAVWQHADPDLPPLRRVQALATRLALSSGNRAAFPTVCVPTQSLERLGPSAWRPFPAPDFALRDPDGKTVRLADFRGHNLILVFYLGGKCPLCMQQLAMLGREKPALDALDTRVAAVSWDQPAVNRAFLAANPGYPLLLLSELHGRVRHQYKAYDDFENIVLHATFLIDRNGGVWWYNADSEPFTNTAFLKSEIARMNAWEQRQARPIPPVASSGSR